MTNISQTDGLEEEFKNKDIERQREIIEHLHCEFYRYNEATGILWKVEIKNEDLHKSSAWDFESQGNGALPLSSTKRF